MKNSFSRKFLSWSQNMRSSGSTQIKKRRGFGRTFFNLSYLSNSISKSYTQVTQKYINSHAVGMAVTQSLGFEIDFVRNPISGSAA